MLGVTRDVIKPGRAPLPIFPLVSVKMDPSAIRAVLAFQPVPEFFAALVKVIEHQLQLLIAFGPTRVWKDLTVIANEISAS
jgi:hypothetical protein